MLHYRRMRRGDVGAVVRLLVPDEEKELREILRAQLRGNAALALPNVGGDLLRDGATDQDARAGCGGAPSCVDSLSGRDGMAGMLSIHVADGDEDFYVDAVFEGLFQEMRERAKTPQWACRLEELGEGLTFV